MTTDTRLYKNVLEKMLALIDSGEFPVGGRIPPERELAERFDVSRPTIREAIIALETLGHVQVKTGSGVYILDASKTNGAIDNNVTAYELTEARALIEGEAAALAASLITTEELEELERSLGEMAHENEAGDLATGDADEKFHRIISQATRNNMIVSLIEHLWHVRNNVPQVFKAYKSICEMDGAQRVEEHVEIFEALRRRDAAVARTAMHNHFARILNKLIATSEAEQIEQLRQQSQEVRKRFSLDHLVSGDSGLAR